MSSRTVLIEVANGWTDLAAAALPVLVEGKSYAIEWENRTIGYLRLTYAAVAPTEAKGSKVFARNAPDVSPAYFTVPAAPATIWIKALELDIVAEINPTDADGDGSVAP